ncbi:MAG: ATP-binding protein, partial [candidate division Zixibacteria bacterium]|nr:ATP-binding protein [candidate division Zixibacteria bacterium]
EIDSECMHQLVLNLLLNAIEASDSGGTIEVRLERALDNSAIISVRDRGEGMTKEEVDRVFEPFYTSKSSGTGLGLAIAQSIVTKHEGKIEVDSEPRRGTTFRVTLPLTGEAK